MATKTISITEEAYERLKAVKSDNESFSDIINKITKKTDIRKFFGILSKKAADEMEKIIKEGRKGSLKRHIERTKGIQKAFM